MKILTKLKDVFMEHLCNFQIKLNGKIKLFINGVKDTWTLM